MALKKNRQRDIQIDIQSVIRLDRMLDGKREQPMCCQLPSSPTTICTFSKTFQILHQTSLDWIRRVLNGTK